MNTAYKANWNSAKLTWEVAIEEPQGDRMAVVHKEANVVCPMLMNIGINFVEASVGEYNSKPLLLIVNPLYWVDNESTILAWFVESNIKAVLNGMVLEFDNKEDKLMFMLRWA